MIEFSKEEKLNGKHEEKTPRAKGFERKEDTKSSELTIDLLGILIRRKWLIVAAGLIGLMLGAAYFLFMPPKYESRAQILLMQNDSASMATQMARSEPSVSEDLLATHMSLLQSKRLIGRAVSSVPIKLPDEQAREPEAGPESSEAGVDEFETSSEFGPIGSFEEFLDADAGERQESPVLGSDEFEVDDLAVREILNSWVEPLSTLPSIAESLSEDETATDYIIDNLYVTRGGDGAARDARVLTVAFRHSDPEDSLRVTHAIVQEYERFIQEQFKDVNSTAYDLIDRARLELEQKIQEASEDYRAFRQENPLIGSVEGGTNIHAMRYEELSAELSQLLVSIDEAKARLRLVDEGLKRLEGSTGPELQKLALIDDRNAERLGILVTVERGESQTAAFQALQPERMAGATTEYTSLLGMRASLRQAMAEYGEKHPEVQKLQTQLAEMQQFVRDRDAIIGVEDDQAALTPDDVMLAYVNLLENDLKALEFQKEFLEKQMDAEEALAKDLVNAELEDEELAREITRQEDLYNAVLERLRDINMQQDSSGLIQEVIEYPTVGEQVTPNAPIAAAIAMLSAMLIAGGTVLVAELSDKRIHAATDLESLYQSQILSHLPDFSLDPETQSKIKRLRKAKPQISPTVISFHEPKSTISENIRGIRTQLLFSLRGEHNSLCVTSPVQGDGKSTVAANLAVALAQMGKSVVLADCDLRRPTVHTLFGVDNSQGLSDLLMGAGELDDLCQTGVVDNLTLLPSGRTPDNPAELLSTDRFRDFVAMLKSQFDFVVLDCPPVLPVTDAVIVAQLVDELLLVTSLELEDAVTASQCHRKLAAAAIAATGLIVNRASRSGAYYDYAGYAESNPKYAKSYIAS